MMEFDEFAAFLKKSESRVRPELAKDAAEIGEIEQKIAVEMIGRENPQWQPLAASTIEEKERLGYTGRLSATDPLLRTGDMRASIQFLVEPDAIGVAIELGSDDPVAAYQEMGTSTIPPRPFISTATIEAIDPATQILGHTAVDLLTPGGYRAPVNPPILNSPTYPKPEE